MSYARTSNHCSLVVHVVRNRDSQLVFVRRAVGMEDASGARFIAAKVVDYHSRFSATSDAATMSVELAGNAGISESGQRLVER